MPRKKAIFKLNRIGMDITVVYMFILLLLVSMPSLIDQLTATEGQSANLNFLFLLIYFFMFYYLPMTIIVFLMLSLIAYIATIVAKGMRRKLRFSILWKMAAYTTTIPFLLYTVIALLYPVSDVFLLLSLIYTLVLIVMIISVYPRRKIRS
ncbi:DUF1189 family protein [Virgibacillus salidurans]|uniref:DUF1189 family protein n=1 Tax=Virgibacillus salidurans TaxID=2831673 RepID=UPI001F277BF2|nr:DUF1189 family protein [Virgibacillus sp. NKC19-16]